MQLIVAALFIQLCYGGLMAGNHAALFYPTFPKIGSNWIPEGLYSPSLGLDNYFQNPAMIQLIHRSLGLLITILIFIFYFSARKQSTTLFFKRTLVAFPLLVVTQVLLGILTLLNSLGKIPILFAAAHQMCRDAVPSLMLLYQI
jgi:cytochrome c oxidase assembly protein subunit 15